MISRDLGNGTRLVVVPTDKFKTVLVRVHMPAPMDAEVTRRSLLGSVLTRGTRSFPDMTAVQRRLDELYGSAVGADTSKAGDIQLTTFSLSVIDAGLVGDGGGLLAGAIALLREVVREPLREHGRLLPSYVETEKENLARLLRSQKDQKARYAAQRLVEIMFENDPYGRNELGAEEDLPSVEAGALTEFYDRWIATGPMDIMIVGAVDPDAAAELCTPFAAGRARGAGLDACVRRAPCGAVRTCVEEDAIRQSRLAMGYRHGAVLGDAELAAVEMASGILGGFPHSKLFQRVREKESLAYSVSSSYDGTKGALFVSAGVDADAYERAVAAVGEAVAELGAGEFSDDDVRATRACLVRRARSAADSPGSVLGQLYLWSLYGVEYDRERWIEAIEAVTPREIAAAARRLRLDTVYCLRPKRGA